MERKQAQTYTRSLSFIVVPVTTDTASGGCRGTEAGSEALSIFSVPCRGTEVCFREKIGVRPFGNRRRKFTSALNSTTTRTDSTVGTIQLYH